MRGARQRAHSGIEHQLRSDEIRGRSTGARRPLSGRGRKIVPRGAAGSDTYGPADRTDDYSASDFVISEALQQTDFDEIRHGVLSGWTASSSLHR